MRTKKFFTLVLTVLMAAGLAAPVWAKSKKIKMITQTPRMKMTTPIPENVTTPDQVKTPIGMLEFFDGVDCVTGGSPVYFTIADKEPFVIACGQADHLKALVGADDGLALVRGHQSRYKDYSIQVQFFVAVDSQ